jgi:hypothetical protein
MSLQSVQWGELWDGNPEQPSRIPGDVRFRVNDPADTLNPKSFSAHKLLLAAVSPVFQNQFYNDPDFEESGDENIVVSIEDSQPEAFMKLLEFIYFGPQHTQIAPAVKFADMNTVKLVFNLMVLADKYIITELKDLCENLLLNSVLTTEENIFQLINMIDNTPFDMVSKGIKKNCRDFIKEGISTYGFNFVVKLNNQSSFDQKVFRDLCSIDNDNNLSLLNSSILNDTVGLSDSECEQGSKTSKSCSIS